MAGEHARAMLTNGMWAGAPAALQDLAFEEANLQERLAEEMRRLAKEDEQLSEAVADLAAIQIELLQRTGKTTLSRKVTPASGELPYDARLMFDVVMGNQPWRQVLTEDTFTIANVFGEIRKVELECEEGSQRIDYEIGVDWTVPSDWGVCFLQVNAPRETTFRLYEF
jgi:hypothetical protein